MKWKSGFPLFFGKDLPKSAISAELTIIARRANERAEAARRAAFNELQNRAAANNAMLAAAGYDVSNMTKNQRKDALKALRRGANQTVA